VGTDYLHIDTSPACALISATSLKIDC
jgi:hypothetical protein